MILETGCVLDFAQNLGLLLQKKHSFGTDTIFAIPAFPSVALCDAGQMAQIGCQVWALSDWRVAVRKLRIVKLNYYHLFSTVLNFSQLRCISALQYCTENGPDSLSGMLIKS